MQSKPSALEERTRTRSLRRRALARGSAYRRSWRPSSRGAGSARLEEARRFLAADERHDPLALPGVPAACALILAHIGRGSRIAVFGDYDVDGVCSTAILMRALQPPRRRSRLGAAEPLRRGLRALRPRGRAAGRPRRAAARDRRLRHHRGRAGGRRAPRLGSTWS